METSEMSKPLSFLDVAASLTYTERLLEIHRLYKELSAAQAKLARIEAAGREMPEEPYGCAAASGKYMRYVCNLRAIAIAQKVRADENEREFAVLKVFFNKHALGSLATPSCIVCGRADNAVAIQHAELPDIVVCMVCRDSHQHAEKSELRSGELLKLLSEAKSTILYRDDFSEILTKIDAALKEQT